MIEYDEPQSYVLDEVSFSHRGISFTGRGLMKWEPATGFEIQAFLDQSIDPKLWDNRHKTILIQNKNDTRLIRLRIHGFGHAFIPNVPLMFQEAKIIGQRRILIHADRVIFCFSWPTFHQQDYWSGTALFAIDRELDFPDSFKRELSINKNIFSEYTSGALWLDEDDDVSLQGYNIGKNRFELSWTMAKSKWTRQESWLWAESARWALSIVFGKTIRLLKTQVTRGAQDFYELQKIRPVDSVGLLHIPIGEMSPPNPWAFNKTAFLKLCRYFAKQGEHTRVCWAMFHQMAEASKQKSWEGRELLLSTIFEAALRTIDNHPFKENDRSWNRNKSMTQFREKYLDQKWNAVCDEALAAHKRLRHRNAHPDWLSIEGGTLSKPNWSQSMKDIVFTSRFYDYMILALAGFKDMEPRFPKTDSMF